MGFGHHFGANLLLPLIPHGMNPPRLPSVIRKTNQGLSTSVPGQPRGKLSLGQGGWEKFVGLSQRPVLALGIISLWGNKQCWITALHTDIFRMLTTSRSFFSASGFSPKSKILIGNERQLLSLDFEFGEAGGQTCLFRGMPMG